MNITAVSVQTPKKLLAEFKKGNRPEYNHKNDVLMDELDVLVSKYRQSLSVEDKKKLIEQERRILLDGLKNPEMTLARNYENVSKFITPDSKILVDDALRLFDATGFFRLARLSGNFKITPKNEDFEILKQAYFNTDGNTKFGNRAKDIILTTLDSIQQRTPNFKDEITRMLLEIKEKTKNKNLQEYIETVLEGKSVDNLLQDLNLNPDNEKKLQALLLNSKPNSNEKITDLTTRILKRRGVSYETYEFAILGAGKFRSDANFEILKNIALKKADKDARFKECALQSLALYIKDKHDEVKDVLTKVKK